MNQSQTPPWTEARIQARIAEAQAEAPHHDPARVAAEVRRAAESRNEDARRGILPESASRA